MAIIQSKSAMPYAGKTVPGAGSGAIANRHG
jgi:hypothetical protein